MAPSVEAGAVGAARVAGAAGSVSAGAAGARIGAVGAAPVRIVVGASGASGTPLLVRCLEVLRAAPGVEVHLVMTDGARTTACEESALSVEGIEALADAVHDNSDVGACIASGSFDTAGMLVVPCSMKTVAGIAAGYADNLLLRAADVTLKEQRPLVLAARETPLSAIHLRNLHELSCVPGVRIVPPMMSFYQHPKTIDDMVNQVTARLLAPFGVEVPGYRRWEGAAHDA